MLCIRDAARKILNPQLRLLRRLPLAKQANRGHEFRFVVMMFWFVVLALDGGINPDNLTRVYVCTT